MRHLSLVVWRPVNLTPALDWIIERRGADASKLQGAIRQTSIINLLLVKLSWNLAWFEASFNDFHIFRLLIDLDLLLKQCFPSFLNRLLLSLFEEGASTLLARLSSIDHHNDEKIDCQHKGTRGGQRCSNHCQSVVVIYQIAKEDQVVANQDKDCLVQVLLELHQLGLVERCRIQVHRVHHRWKNEHVGLDTWNLKHCKCEEAEQGATYKEHDWVR